MYPDGAFLVPETILHSLRVPSGKNNQAHFANNIIVMSDRASVV